MCFYFWFYLQCVFLRLFLFFMYTRTSILFNYFLFWFLFLFNVYTTHFVFPVEACCSPRLFAGWVLFRKLPTNSRIYEHIPSCHRLIAYEYLYPRTFVPPYLLSPCLIYIYANVLVHTFSHRFWNIVFLPTYASRVYLPMPSLLPRLLFSRSVARCQELTWGQFINDRTEPAPAAAHVPARLTAPPRKPPADFDVSDDDDVRWDGMICDEMRQRLYFSCTRIEKKRTRNNLQKIGGGFESP